MAWNQQYPSGPSFDPAYPSQSQPFQLSQRTLNEPNFGGDRSTEREAREKPHTASSQARQEHHPGLSQWSGFQPFGNGQWGQYYQPNGFFYPEYATSQGSTRHQPFNGLTSEQTSGTQVYPQGGHINPAFLPQPPVANYGQAATAATSNTLTTGYGGAYSGFGPAYNGGQWPGYDFGYETNQVAFPYSQTHKASWQQSWAQYGNAIQQNQTQAEINLGIQEPRGGKTRYALRSSHGPPSEPKGVHDPLPARLVNPTYTRSLQLTPSGENPRLYLLPRPEPSESYLERALVPPHRLSQPKKLLIVLDLNGTLLLREGKGTKHTPRPNVHEFLRYCLAHHAVMVWSSARPHNVIPMVKQLFNPKQQEQLVGVWSRKDLRLGEHYEKKVQVYKQLTWLWDDVEVQAGFPAPASEYELEDGSKEPLATKWDQSNTLLIDDSINKAASEPYNLLQIDEFTAENKNNGTDALGRVLAYIENLKWEADVSSAMREQPFVNGEGDKWDWGRNRAVPAEGVTV